MTGSVPILRDLTPVGRAVVIGTLADQRPVDRHGVGAGHRGHARVRRQRDGHPGPRLRRGHLHGASRWAGRAPGRGHPQRDVWQHRGAHHRVLRADRRPDRGGQGVAHRLHHRQPAAGAGCQPAAGWPAPRAPEVLGQDRGHGCHAAGAGGHRAVRACHLRALDGVRSAAAIASRRASSSPSSCSRSTS